MRPVEPGESLTRVLLAQVEDVHRRPRVSHRERRIEVKERREVECAGELFLGARRGGGPRQGRASAMLDYNWPKWQSLAHESCCEDSCAVRGRM